MSFYRDRLALVVGGSEGIGRAVAQALVGRGARVVLAARRQDVLEGARAALGALATSSFDVADWTGTLRAVDAIVATHGVPDIVVNCAGLAHPAWIVDSEIAHIDQMTRVNYMGTVHVAKAVMPHFIQRRGGVLVNTASIGGLIGLYGYSGYCGSKFAVMGFSEALRREVTPYGIGVTVLCPPNTRTPGLERENLHKPPEVLKQEEKVAVLEPAVVAKKLLDALPRRPRVVIPSLDGRLAWLLSRCAPWMLDLILERSL